MLTDQPLYRARALEPVLGYDDVAMLIDQGGPIGKYDSAFFGVQGIRPFFGVYSHGLFLIWNQGAAAPAGYGTQAGGTVLPSGCPTGSIAAGASVNYPAPAPLQLGNYQLVQARFTMEALALTGAVTLHDLDLQLQNGAANDYLIGPNTGQPGTYNMQDQVQSPADSIVDPAQNANKALPAAFPQANPWDLANLTEIFWFEQQPPSFTLRNNGGASITGGSVGLRFKGFRYNLVPLTPDSSWPTRWVAGGWRQAPPVQRIVTLPTVPPTGTSTW